jgi:hypothetical protein
MSERTDDGQCKGEPTAMVVYKAPIPTLFATEPLLDIDGSETPPVVPESQSAAQGPTLPRAATLDDASAATGEPGPHASRPESGAAKSHDIAAKSPPRPGRFPLLAASVAFAACLGAVAGSWGHGEIQRILGAAAPAVARADTPEDVRALKDSVAQLRANVKMLSDNLAAIRASATATTATMGGQLTKIAEALDRVEHADRRTAAVPVPAAVPAPAPAPDVTGSISAPAGADAKPGVRPPPIVEGWVVRKVYDGTALVEGRYGMIEIEPGMSLPGLGRVQEIRRQDGHWVVVTNKGLIMPVR